MSFILDVVERLPNVYIVLPIIIFIIEVLLIGYYIFHAIKTQKFITKGTIFYFVPLSIVLFTLYTLGANYKAMINDTPLTIMDYLTICKSVLSATVFELRTDYLTDLMNVSLMYKLAYSLAVALSLACVYTSLISLIINTATNKVRLILALRKNCDILIGENEYNDEYIARSKNVIVITDCFKSERLNEYYAKKVPVIQGKFTKKLLLKQFKYYIQKGRELNFISFQKSDTNLGYIKEFEDFLFSSIKGGRILDFKKCFLKVELDFENQFTIKNKILENQDISPFIDCFSRYELFALDFIYKNPITEHLPKDFIDEELGVINNDKVINVVYLGFGKLAKSLHRAQLMNDQLPIKIDNKLQRYKINYYAFDKSESASQDKNMSFFFKRYDENISKYSGEDYFPSLDKLDNLKLNSINLESFEFINKIAELIEQGKRKDEFNRFIVSFGEDIDNIDMALKIDSILKEHNYSQYEIYVRVKGKFPSAIKLLENDKISIIGDIPSVFNHDVIVNESLLELAKLVNRKYNSGRLVNSSWYSLSSIKQSSNIYSSLNIRLKINLLGYDFVKENGIVDNSKILGELENKVKCNKKTYHDYLFFKNNLIKVSDSLAYQEHLRWNAFYIANGYVPLSKKSIKLLSYDEVNGPTFIKDDSNLRLHACLTTYEGLDEYHKLLAKLLTEVNNKSLLENLEIVETYRYDHMLIEEFKTIFTNSCYRLIERR